MDAIPWAQIFNTTTAGWGLFAGLAWLVITLIVRGTLWTDPAVQAILRREAALEQMVKERDAQIALLLKEGIPTQTAFMEAVKEAAESLVAAGKTETKRRQS